MTNSFNISCFVVEKLLYQQQHFYIVENRINKRSRKIKNRKNIEQKKHKKIQIFDTLKKKFVFKKSMNRKK